MKAIFWTAAFSLVGGLLSAGIILLVSSPPHGPAILLSPPPTPAPYIVQVAGAVKQPGVVSLSPGSRVRDAVEAAGGILPSGDTEAVNLAALLEDGQKLVIPTRIPVVSSTSINSSPAATSIPYGMASQSLININLASQVQLETLPGIGPVTAQEIIQYRDTNGPFRDIDDILDVPGIGPATLDKIRDLITVEGQ